MELFQEYKELYYKELEHSERLNNKIGNSIAVISLIASGNLLIWQKYFTTTIDTIFLLLCFISFVLFVITFFAFLRAFSGYRYAYFPTTDMNRKIEQTKIRTKGINNGDDMAAKHIKGMLERTYIKCANLNFDQNITKNTRYKKFTTISIISIFALVVAYIYNIAIIENIHL